MKPAEVKADRLLKIEALLLAHPEGLTQAELARRLGVNRSTVSRYFRDMPNLFPYFESDDGRLFMDRQAYFVNVRFGLHEAMAVHLASRLLATRMDRQNPHAASALRKLGLALERLAPRISHHIQQSADVMDEAAQRHDPVYLQALERLTLAWAEQRKVQVWHRSDKTGKVFEYLFSPFFIEPYAVGQTTHVIGHSDPPGELRTFKIERIGRVEITQQPFAIPPNFDPRDLLANAWGIWYSDNEPVEVVLKFHPRVAHRVRETRWHRSEEETELPDGSILWKAKVAEPQEMLPWIRGWGADVEVLEPPELRHALRREAVMLANLYQAAGAQSGQTHYYAHTKDGKDKSEWQQLIDHLTRTADLAVEFGRDAGLGDLARIAGLTHDLGKYSREFQARLDGSGRKVDHATAGAIELTQMFKGTPQDLFAVILAYCISGHHTGLLDYGDSTDLPGDGTLQARLKTQVCDYSAYKTELDLSKLEFPKWLNIHPLQLRLISDKPAKVFQGFSISFAARILYSALVDADFQETEEFIRGKKPRRGHESIGALCEKLNTYLHYFDNPVSDINRKRNETLKACIEKAAEKPGFFKLTVPTGGGKTLASMAFALNHAAQHGLRRIIYVIPFTSIIEQNAGVFKDILGEENVLEHHSNFDWEGKKRETKEAADDQTRSVYAKLKLAAENWDIPIVVTTNVQFFESLFANKSSRCRKLHNIAKSVIIFDEAQMFPRDYMLPAIGAVWELVTNYGSSAVFCTATQPNLEKFLPAGTIIKELAPHPQSLFDFYKRVHIEDLGVLPDADLVSRLIAHEQVLCIVNTRRHASGLFQMMDSEDVFHLSTLMCPAHRRQVLTQIRQRLDRHQACRVISTSVMEAGIDVDFPVGYRALAGLDSINQAAGRVNRNMKLGSGNLFVFESESEFIKRTPRYVAQGVAVTRGVLRAYCQAPISIPAVDAYFEQLYALKDVRDFDYKDILGCFDDQQPVFKFATVAEKFKVIEENTQTVIISYDEEARRLIDELKFTQFPSSTLRKLQPYTVSIYQGEFEALSSKGVILTIAEAYPALSQECFEDYYHPDTGLLVPASVGGDAIFS